MTAGAGDDHPEEEGQGSSIFPDIVRAKPGAAVTVSYFRNGSRTLSTFRSGPMGPRGREGIAAPPHVNELERLSRASRPSAGPSRPDSQGAFTHAGGGG